jgi:hypothetical protein
MRGRFGLFGFLVIAVLVLLIGGVAYNSGIAAGQAQVAAPGTVAYPVGYVHPWGFGFGFGIFGFLFVFLIIGLLFAALRPRRWGGPGGGGWGRGMGPGGWGPGGWGSRFDPDDPRTREWMQRDVPPAFQPMLEAWHRRAHGEAPGGAGPTGPTAGGTTPQGGSGFGQPSSGPGDGPTATR